MNYWIFKANPDLYDIDARLRDPEDRTTWNATRYRGEMMPGDIAFIWRTGKRPGIVATVKLEASPQEMDEITPDKTYWKDQNRASTKWRVVGSFTHRIRVLTREKILTTPGLENLSVFRGFQQATNFRVSASEGQRVMELVGSSVSV